MKNNGKEKKHDFALQNPASQNNKKEIELQVEISALKLEKRLSDVINNAEKKVTEIEQKEKDFEARKKTAEKDLEKGWKIIENKWNWAEIALGIISLVLAIAGFVGYSKWVSITEEIEVVKQSASDKLEEIEKIKSEANEVFEWVKIQKKEFKEKILKDGVEKLSPADIEKLKLLAESTGNLKEWTGEGWFFMGLKYQEREEYDKAIKFYNKAIEAYKKAVENNPKNDDIYEKMGSTYFKLWRIYDSVWHDIRFKKEYEKEKINEYFEKRFDSIGKAIEAYEKAVENNPENYEACILLAESYSWGGYIDKAIEVLEKTLKNDPENSATYYYNMGIVYMHNQKPEADKFFEKAISIDPKLRWPGE